MSGLWPGALLLLALAAVFVLFPRWFVRAQQHRSLRADNLEWYAQRQRELASEPESSQLLQDAQLRLLEDGVDSLAEEHTEMRTWRGWLLLLPLVALTLLLYLQLGAAPDVALARGLQGLDEGSSEAEFSRLRQQLEVRAGQRPDNLHYQAMLGSFNMNEGNYGAARDIYQGLVERAPEDASALALAAQAGFLAAGRQLDQDNRMLAQRALSIDPHQRTALGLLGMAAYENGQYRDAIGYWRRLQGLESADSASGQMIASVIQMAEQAMGNTGEEAEVAVATPSSAGVSVTIQFPPGSTAAPDDSVFVFARDPNSGSRMPVAAQRFPASRLPLTLRLDDSTSMAGQRISQLAQVVVIARVSPGGRPGEEYASWQAQIGPLAPSQVEEPRMLILQRKKI